MSTAKIIPRKGERIYIDLIATYPELEIYMDRFRNHPRRIRHIPTGRTMPLPSSPNTNVFHMFKSQLRKWVAGVETRKCKETTTKG